MPPELSLPACNQWHYQCPQCVSWRCWCGQQCRQCGYWRAYSKNYNINKMFKKAIKVGVQNQLSGKDKKNIKAKLQAAFDPESIQHLFGHNDKIISSKVSGSKTIIYMGEDYPLLVDGNGKGEYFPSIYTTAAYEPLLKTVHLNEGVETYIFNGANLMWPGVRDFSQLAQFKKDQVVALASAKGEIIAIGALGCSYKDLENDAKTGVAAYILTYKGDKLWDMGNKFYPDPIMKKPKAKEEIEKFTELQEKDSGVKVQEAVEPAKEEPTATKKQVVKKQEPKSEEDDESDDPADFMNLVHAKKNEPKMKMVEKKGAVFDEDDDKKNKKGKNKKGKKKGYEEDEDDVPKNQKAKQKKKEKVENQSNSDNDGEKAEHQDNVKSVVNKKLMDQQMKEAFLNSLKLSKVEGELPIDSGRFYAEYMSFATSAGVHLEPKESSYKRMGRFYEEMAKLKFIEFKAAKEKKGQQGSMITKILWENQELHHYVPTIKKLRTRDADEKEEVTAKEKLKLSKTLTVDYVYKLKPDLKTLLFKKEINVYEDSDEDKGKEPEYYMEQQVKAKIEAYISKLTEVKNDNKKQQKQEKQQKTIVVDYKKNDYLQNLLKKEIEEFEENQVKEDMMKVEDEDEEDKKKKKNKKAVFRTDRNSLAERIMKTGTHSFYHLIDPENKLDKLKDGVFKGIEIIAEKFGNKNVTRVLGLDYFIVPSSEIEAQIHGFAGILQKKLASSATVQNLPGKNGGKEIMLQGVFVDDLQEMLVKDYGAKKEFITIVNKLDKKKKH